MLAANVDTARGPADVKARIAAVGPAQFRQPLDESGELSPPPRIALVRTQEHADAPHPLGLLRPRRERPRGGRAADERDELTPPHVEHGSLTLRVAYSVAWGCLGRNVYRQKGHEEDQDGIEGDFSDV